MAIVGAAIGLTMALPLPNVFGALFYDLHLGEPRIYIIVPLCIFVVALLATYLPAAAPRIGPMRALRRSSLRSYCFRTPVARYCIHSAARFWGRRKALLNATAIRAPGKRPRPFLRPQRAAATWASALAILAFALVVLPNIAQQSRNISVDVAAAIQDRYR